MLRPSLLASISSLLFCGAALAGGGGEPAAPEIVKARGAVKMLSENLRSELMAAMKAGGPAAAVEKCKVVAPAVARDASSSAEGFIVGRTALRVRNPQNSPDALERRVLEEFARKLKAGADPATLEYSEEVAQAGVTLVRYMKAIPMVETPCLACHGPPDKLDPAAMAEVKKLYPSDQATGFAPGDLRGAFSVTVRKK